MKIKSLLAAVSAVAISAGSAHALELSTTGTQVKLANELEPGNTKVEVPFSLDVSTTNGTFNANQVTRVTITLPAGLEFDVADITDASPPTSGGGHLPNNQTGSDTLTSDNATISSVTTTQLVVDVDPSNGETGLGFDLPIVLKTCPAASAALTVTAALASGNVAVENGTTMSTTILPTCVNGLSGAVASDEATANTQVALPDYNSLIGGNVLGSVNYTLNPMASINGTGTAISASDIASISFDVVFADASGIATVSYLGSACSAPTTAKPNTFTCTATGANIATATDGTADDITITAVGPTGSGTTAAVNAIVNQGVSVSNALVTFSDANADFIPSEAGAVGGLDALDREGANFGPFDWNGRTGTDNVYRITGLSGPTVGTVTFTKDVAGMNGTFPIMLTPTNGEAVLTSFTSFGTTNTDYRRADISISLETADPVDIDRLMIRNGIVTNFGDGANRSATGMTPDTDSDDAANE